MVPPPTAAKSHALLPGQIAFYGDALIVRTDAPVRKLPTHLQAILCGFVGSTRVRSLVLLVDEDLDESLFSEIANILASRAAGALAREEGWEVSPTPPARLDAKAWDERRRALLEGAHGRFHYVLQQGAYLIPLEVILIEGAKAHG